MPARPLKFARVCKGGYCAGSRQDNRLQLKAARPAIAGGVHRRCAAGYCDIVRCGDRQGPNIRNHDLTSRLVAGKRGRGLIRLGNEIGHACWIGAKQSRLESAEDRRRGWHVGIHRNRKGEIGRQPAGEDGRRGCGFWGGRLGQNRAERAVRTQKPEYAIRARPRMCVTYGAPDRLAAIATTVIYAGSSPVKSNIEYQLLITNNMPRAKLCHAPRRSGERQRTPLLPRTLGLMRPFAPLLSRPLWLYSRAMQTKVLADASL